MATFLVPGETKIKTCFEEACKNLVEPRFNKAQAVLRKQNLTLLTEIFHRKIDSAYQDVRTSLPELINLQLNEDKKEYVEPQASYNKVRMISIATIILGLTTGISVGI